jgi:hypothetical protein
MNGFDGQKELGGNLDVFDLSDHAWSTITFPADGKSGPEARSVSVLIPLHVQTKTYLLTFFGEHDPSSHGHAGAGKMMGDVWAYDIEAGTWTEWETNGDAPEPRGWFDADVAKDVKGKEAIIVHGGLAEDNSRLGDVWMLQVA